MDHHTSSTPAIEHSDGASEYPERQWTDYAEITFLVLMLLIGAPLNLLSICRSIDLPIIVARKKSSAVNSTSSPSPSYRIRLLSAGRSSHNGSLRNKLATISQFKSLQIHLSIANLMIICVYGLSQICWLITIEWRGGDYGCRLVKTMHTFCFYATSNMVAMIAIDRLLVTIYVDRQNSRGRVSRFLRGAIALAWLLACGSSLPQAFFWRAYAPFPESPNWYQCVTFWVAERHLAVEMPHHHDDNHNGTVNESAAVANGSDTFYEDLYGGTHLFLVFWFPALIIVGSYGVIVAKFHTKIRQTNRETIRRRQCKRENEKEQVRQRLVSLHPVNSLSHDGNNDSKSTESDKFDSDSPAAARGGEQRSIKILTLPIIVHSTQATAALRRRSRGDALALHTLTRAKRTTLRKTMWILTIYVLCWSPYNILELWRYFDTSFENSYLEFLSNLIVLNAVLNPLIYSI